METLWMSKNIISKTNEIYQVAKKKNQNEGTWKSFMLGWMSDKTKLACELYIAKRLC